MKKSASPSLPPQPLFSSCHGAGQGQHWTSASFPDIPMTTTIVATRAAGAGGTMSLLVSGLLSVEEATATE